MLGYYSEKLSANRLEKVYSLTSPRIRQYLDAELHHVLFKIRPHDTILELGCGYGRILSQLAKAAGEVFGIDSSLPSLHYGGKTVKTFSNCHLTCMDAAQLAFPDRIFDVVICIQNGISAFHVDTKTLINESVRVLKPGGTALFSSYSNKFWDERLAWFEQQAQAGLLGASDYRKTGNGEIVCHDGFTATTMTPARFLSLIVDMDVHAEIFEVDSSSVFYEIIRH